MKKQKSEYTEKISVFPAFFLSEVLLEDRAA